MQDNMNVNVKNNNTNIAPLNNVEKKTRIRFLIISLVCFIAVPLSNIILLFKPIYKVVYYGQANLLFLYGGAVLLLLIYFCLIKFILIKKLDVNYNKTKEPMNIKNTIMVFITTFILIFFIGYLIDFNVKPFYDLGKSFTGFQLIIQAVKLLYYATIVLFINLMIENFQYALDGIIPFKNKTISSYFPYGGIVTMLLFGSYSSILHITNFEWLYFLLILVFGEIYLLTNRSLLKTYASTLLIYLF